MHEAHQTNGGEKKQNNHFRLNKREIKHHAAGLIYRKKIVVCCFILQTSACYLLKLRLHRLQCCADDPLQNHQFEKYSSSKVSQRSVQQALSTKLKRMSVWRFSHNAWTAHWSEFSTSELLCSLLLSSPVSLLLSPLFTIQSLHDIKRSVKLHFCPFETLQLIISYW